MKCPMFNCRVRYASYHGAHIRSEYFGARSPLVGIHKRFKTCAVRYRYSNEINRRVLAFLHTMCFFGKLQEINFRDAQFFFVWFKKHCFQQTLCTCKFWNSQFYQDSRMHDKDFTIVFFKVRKIRDLELPQKHRGFS